MLVLGRSAFSLLIWLWVSGLPVRLNIFRLFFTTKDELTYDVVSGVKSSTAGPLTTVVLHTRITDYILRYVNALCAKIFIEYIESKRLEKGTYENSSTNKGRNIYVDGQVALTIQGPGTLQTLQIQGTAEVETNQTMKDSVFTQLTKPRVYQSETHLPPVTKLQDGSFMVIKITPSTMSYHDYAKLR